MRRCVLPLTLLILLAIGGPRLTTAAGTIKEVDLKEGHDGINSLRAPVYDTATVPPIRIGDFGARYDRAAPITRNAEGGLFNFGPTYDLDPKIDLAALLTQTLRDEAPRMGFVLGDGGWTIGGTLDSVAIESRQPSGWAPVQYHCHLRLSLEVKAPDDSTSSSVLRLHSYQQVYSAGGMMVRKGTAEKAIARMLVEGAQELLARLNRAHFHAPAHPAIAKKLAALSGKWSDATEAVAHQIGLSGSAEAVPVLTGILAKDKDEDHRSRVLEALARIGDPSVVALLAARYATEDEDCRWYTLKVFDYLGTDEAIDFVRERGAKDADIFCKVLAEDITAAR